MLYLLVKFLSRKSFFFSFKGVFYECDVHCLMNLGGYKCLYSDPIKVHCITCPCQLLYPLNVTGRPFLL